MRKFIKIGLILLSLVVVLLFFLKVELMRQGGPVMVLILLSSIFAVAVVIEKLGQFFAESAKTDILLKNIFESIDRQRIKEAIDNCNQADVSVGRVLRAGIIKYDRPKEEIRDAMQDAFDLEMPLLENKLSILSTIIQVAPLLGFLGTLIGLLDIFKAVSSGPGGLAAAGGIHFVPGIEQALICSVSSFIVAIPALVAYNYLNYKLKSIVEDIEFASTRLLNFLIDRRMP